LADVVRDQRDAAVDRVMGQHRLGPPLLVALPRARERLPHDRPPAPGVRRRHRGGLPAEDVEEAHYAGIPRTSGFVNAPPTPEPGRPTKCAGLRLRSTAASYALSDAKSTSASAFGTSGSSGAGGGAGGSAGGVGGGA